ncbi:MAG TPA: FAD-dependent oxidoreductase [Steroidobacteraceae bacterium]|jgi:NADPH-dependent 2,4-dienoyl-CoA reductase/sulfur reductase-like enzyme/nitrite reductase/ring-hydroxylating ferredoxin subunit|nr:FAD-dependent oxidoreductase [Steroidobacteraceae bacterium]
MDLSSLPDLRAGIEIRDIADGTIVSGRVDSDEAILVRRGPEYFAVGAQCTHYHGPLAQGLIVADTVRCPLHHACFSLRTGAALRAPALDPLARWRVECTAGKVFVRERLELPPTPSAAAGASGKDLPSSITIVGGGAAGLAAADALRREGYPSAITIISADSAAPYDRPNLSKDFLMGEAPAEWMPLRSAEYYSERKIELMLDARVQSLDLERRAIQMENGKRIEFHTLLLATGADPVRLDIPVSGEAKLFYLRSFDDSRAIIAAAAAAKRVVVVGASFIGLEVAASLRHRGIEVHVVGPERVLFERVLGAELGALVRSVHESHGVTFHLGTAVARVDGKRVSLKDGTGIDADLLVLGVGVHPRVKLAEQAGLAIDRGIAVDEYLETSAKGVFAAGDIARWPDPYSGDRIRVEHWVVAERQGQAAALNMLGRRQRFDAVPFFWSRHYDFTINYVGHAESWDALEIEGSITSRDCAVTYRRGGRILAVATISRDLTSLKAERDLELTQASTP